MRLIFLVYILILFFYTWYNLVFNKNFNSFDVKNLYLDNIKSGDIFLIANTKPNKVLGDLFLNIEFYHPSLVLWEGSNLFILEYGVYPGEKGFLKIPFRRWIKFNKNKLILHNPLKIKENENNIREELSNNMVKFYKERKEDFNKLDTKSNINNLRILFRLSKKINFNNILCTEVITILLYYLKLVDNNKNIMYYKSSDFIKLKGFNIKDNFSYNENYLCNFQHLMKNYL